MGEFQSDGSGSSSTSMCPPRRLAIASRWLESRSAACTHVGADWSRVVIGHVFDEVERHPNADNLFVAKVDVGEEHITLVTAAPNLKGGEVVPVVRSGGRVTTPSERSTLADSAASCQRACCTPAELGIWPDTRGAHLRARARGAYRRRAGRLPLGDDVLDIELTTNRPDMSCGPRDRPEISAITGAPLHLPWENCRDRDRGSTSPAKNESAKSVRRRSGPMS